MYINLYSYTVKIHFLCSIQSIYIAQKVLFLISLGHDYYFAFSCKLDVVVCLTLTLLDDGYHASIGRLILTKTQVFKIIHLFFQNDLCGCSRPNIMVKGNNLKILPPNEKENDY